MFGPVLRLASASALVRVSLASLSASLVLSASLALAAEGGAEAAPPSRLLRASASGASTEAAPADTAALPEDLIERVADDPIWRALVHQARRRIRGRAEAAFEAADFFLSPEGSRRPELELRATLEAFNDPDADRAQRARCRFPARYQFAIERGVLPEAGRGLCPELDAWRAAIGETTLTLVFPESFLGNPASMFGHTLLRFDPVPSDERVTDTPLLGWTLDYAADPRGDRGLVYALRGISGGYFGQFGIAPYYEKTKLYSDWQDRNIWEYPLPMEAPGRERVLLHVWELREIALPYFFFTQNCSERLLEVLAVGRPELGRGGGFPPLVTPIDTLRALARASGGPLPRPNLRASPAARLQAALAPVDGTRFATIDALAAGRLAPDDPRLATVPEEERAEILSLAYDQLRHAFLAGKVSEADSRERSYALLRARGALGVAPTTRDELVPLDATPPDEGHGTARVDLAGGIQDRDGFIEWRLRPAYHSMIDDPAGFAEGGEIRAFETALRYFPERNRFRVHEFVLLDITSASPWRRPFRPLGWHAEIGLRTRLVSSDRNRGPTAEPVFRSRAGVGAASAPAPRLLLYGFGELLLEAGAALEGDATAGPLTRAGLSWSTREGRFSVRAEALAGALLGRDSSEWLRAEIEGRLTLSEQWSATLGGHIERAYDVGHFEGRIGLIRYF